MKIPRILLIATALGALTACSDPTTPLQRKSVARAAAPAPVLPSFAPQDKGSIGVLRPANKYR